MPIVDCHVNIYEDRHLVPSKEIQAGRIRPGAMQPKADADSIYRAMAGVDKAIIFTLRCGESTGIEGDDETTAAAVAKYPDKLVGFAYVNPTRPGHVEALRCAVEDLGLVGVKYGPIYNEVPLDDPRLTPIYEYLVRHDLPLLVHMGTTYTRRSPLELGRPITVEPLALRYPDLKIIMAHLGHPWFEECVVLIRKQPNVFADISALFYRPWQYYNALITAQEYLVTDKLYFGTDYPVTTVEETIAGLRNVNNLVGGTSLPRVSDETIERILHSDPFANWWHDWRAKRIGA
jgi:predicted TIM-barrel fold metal-dependent hydrolase